MINTGQCLDGVNRQQGRFHFFGHGNYRFNGAFCRQKVIFVKSTEPFGPHSDLVRRFFAGNIENLPPLSGQRGQHMQQKCRFADSRITANQDNSTGHNTPSQNPVKFFDSGFSPDRILLWYGG